MTPTQEGSEWGSRSPTHWRNARVWLANTRTAKPQTIKPTKLKIVRAVASIVDDNETSEQRLGWLPYTKVAMMFILTLCILCMVTSYTYQNHQTSAKGMSGAKQLLYGWNTQHFFGLRINSGVP